jgi:hypothetical protein
MAYFVVNQYDMVVVAENGFYSRQEAEAAMAEFAASFPDEPVGIRQWGEAE